jgi:hypothetical protein
MAGRGSNERAGKVTARTSDSTWQAWAGITANHVYTDVQPLAALRPSGLISTVSPDTGP